MTYICSPLIGIRGYMRSRGKIPMYTLVHANYSKENGRENDSRKCYYPLPHHAMQGEGGAWGAGKG